MTRKLVPLLILLTFFLSNSSNAANKEKIFYLVIEDIVEPMQIGTHNDPMKGGIITDIVKEMFMNSPYELVPIIGPYNQLLTFAESNTSWISYGGAPPDSRRKVSREPLFEFKSVLIHKKTKPMTFFPVENLFKKQLILVHQYDYPGLDPFLKSVAGGPITDFRAKNPVDALEMLNLDRGDAYVDFETRARYNMTLIKMKKDDFETEDFSKIIPLHSWRIMYHFQTKDKLKEYIESSIKKLKKENRIRKIISHYEK